MNHALVAKPRNLPSPEPMPRDGRPHERSISGVNGASVAIRVVADGELLEVRDARSRLLFQYDPESGKTEVWAPDGDLAFRASGNVEFVAGQSVTLRGSEAVALEAGEGNTRSMLRLGKLSTELRTSALRLAADTTDAVVREASLKLERLRSIVADATLTVTRLETTADRVFERAKNVFRTVEGVHQLIAGRSRTLLEGGFELRAGHASIDARDDVKIDGKSIHLG